MSDQNNTPPPLDIELKFQMQAMTISNNDSGAERPRWLIMRILRWTLMILLMVVLR
jgi:hypothetical protein